MATQATQKAARGKTAAPAAVSEFDFTRSPIHLLRRAQQRALEIFNKEVGASGLTPRQFVVLLAVQENEGLTQTDLVNRTRIDRSTLADMISRLIKRGLLGRRRTERDQRANAVTITNDGRKALKAALGRIARAEERLLEMVPESRRSAFIDNLGVLAGAPDDDAKPATPAAKPAKAAARTAKVAAAPAPKPGPRGKAPAVGAAARKPQAAAKPAAAKARGRRGAAAIAKAPVAPAKAAAPAKATAPAKAASAVKAAPPAEAVAKPGKPAKPAAKKAAKAKDAKPAKKAPK